MRFRELKLRKDPECPVCGTHPSVTELIDYEQFCGLRPEPQPALAGAAANDWEITAVELKRRLDAGDDLFILDVREPNEYQINRIPGSTLIPLGELPRRYEELPRDREIIAQCKVGARSAKASGVPENGRFLEGEKSPGRDPRLGRQGGSVAGEILIPDHS